MAPVLEAVFMLGPKYNVADNYPSSVFSVSKVISDSEAAPLLSDGHQKVKEVAGAALTHTEKALVGRRKYVKFFHKPQRAPQPRDH